MLISSLLVGLVGCTTALQVLPPLPDTSSTGNTSALAFDLSTAPRVIYITQDIAGHRDTSGLTLIPPSGQEFATTFVNDLNEVTSEGWSLELIDEIPSERKGVLLTQFRGNSSDLAYENGSPTEEGYQLDVDQDSIVIAGAGSRGMWWGTRTVLQQLILSNFSSLAAQSSADAPSYSTRGYMLDCGRHHYSLSLLKDHCTFASFFKMSEFNYHTSDNYPLNRGKNETWQDVYSHFSLRPEDPELLSGLAESLDGSLTRQEYGELEQHCAAHGVAVIPEIEAPGHCLTITKWKPELALPKRDLLNLSHPESIPTVKQIWSEFLPWFNVKEVHIGADEYDATLGTVYVNFVNEMASYINTTANKSVRAWGTPFDQPSEPIRIDPSVIMQQWQVGQSDPVQLAAEGHAIINSQDWWAYQSLKNDHQPILPARYPQFFNNTRILNFANQEGRQWDPSLFNPYNSTPEYQLPPSSPANKGAIMAAWNDNGPIASTQLEAYYGWRRGIPIVAARAWSGSRGTQLDAELIDASIDFLTSRAPGQNLDRKLPATAPDTPLLTWSASSNSPSINRGSKGMNHTLHLTTSGPFNLSSSDVTLSLTPEGKLIYTSDGTPYPLRSVSETDGFDPGHPGRIWTNVSSSSHGEVVLQTPAEIVITTTAVDGSRVWVDGEWAGRFEVFVFGGRNTLFSWSQMAFVAPLDEVEGDLQALEVWDGVRSLEEVNKNGTSDGEGTSGVPEVYAPSNGTWSIKVVPLVLTVLAGLLTVGLCI